MSWLLLLLVVVVVAVIFALVYVWLTWHFNYWRKRNVRVRSPQLLVGSFPSLLTQKRHFADEINDLYKAYRDSEHFIGIYLMRVPQLMLLDSALVREVFVTAFRHFQDNDVCKLVDHKKDPLIACNPFILEGQHWREQRALITPGLTSSHIKVACEIMRGVCGKMSAFVKQELQMMGLDGIDVTDLALRFTSENVSASVLGIEANSFTAHPLPIAEKMLQFSQNNTLFVIYNLMVGLFPNIHKLFKPKFVPQDCEDFFISLMERAFQLRHEKTVQRPDFLNYLISLQKKKAIADKDMASHVWTFIIDGLDTSASAIAHCLLLLARNPSAQERLRDELLQHMTADGSLSFEDLNELPYLDACVHESLRMYPPGLWSTKLCTEAHEFTNRDGSKLLVTPGEIVLIPVYSIHMDAAHYANPMHFQPERFLPGNNGGLKRYRERGVYLAFGDGPRTCMGMRFALAQVKSAITALVRDFHIRVNAKTQREHQLDPKSFVAAQKGGIFLDFECRNDGV